MRKTVTSIYDAHLHMGFLSDKDLILPSTVRDFISRHNVCGGAIMPTAKRGGDDNFDIHCKLYRKAEIEGLTSILYITPAIIKQLENALPSKLANCKFIGVKIHPDAMKYSMEELNALVEFAFKLHLPMFIHTGGRDSCESKRFECLIAQYTQQIFVLCHARPADQAFKLINHYPNVWIDTAFLTIEDLKNGINDFNQKRILFGSDYPANRWYVELPEENEWYNSLVLNIKSNLSAKQADDILYYNYQKFVTNYKKQIKI